MIKTSQSWVLLLAFICTVKLSFQCRLPLGWTFPTLEERTRKAPLVVLASMIKKVPVGLLGSETFGPSGGSYTACLNVMHVFKGTLPNGDVCATGFGEPVFCRTDLAFGVTYVVFLNTEPLSARYEFIAPAAVPSSGIVLAQVERGVYLQFIREQICSPDMNI